MRSPASANAGKCSNQRKCLKSSRKVITICLVIIGVILAVSYLFLSQLASAVLSAFLQCEVVIGRADVHGGLRFQDVRICRDGGFFDSEEVLIKVEFRPTGRIGVREIVLSKPVLFLDESRQSFSGMAFPGEMPLLVVNHGNLILKDGFSIDVDYLKLDGFLSPAGFSAEILAELNLHYKKTSSKFAGRISVVGKQDKIRARICSSTIEFLDFKVEDFETCVKFDGKGLSAVQIYGITLDGFLKGSVQADLERKEYLLECELTQLELEALRKSLNIEGDSASGKVDLRIKLTGNAGGWNSLDGNGYLKVKGQNLWEVPILYGLRTLILKSAFKEAGFSEGEGDFEIAGGVLRTENLRLMNKDVGLGAEGRLSFDGKLDFMVTTVFTEKFMDETSGLIKITSFLSKVLDYFIVQYHVGGTISKPSYELIPLPVITTIPMQIKKILGMLFFPK